MKVKIQSILFLDFILTKLSFEDGVTRDKSLSPF